MMPRIRDSVKCEIANIITSSSKANNRHVYTIQLENVDELITENIGRGV